MVSDRLFNVDAQRAAQLQAKLSDVYFYHFTYKGEHSLSQMMAGTHEDYGTSHGDDLSYFLNVVYIPDQHPREGMEQQVENQMIDLWTNFSKHGVPAADGVAWSAMHAESKVLQYLLIDQAPARMTSTPDIGNCKFWESLPINEPEQTFVSNQIKEEL